MKSLFLATLLIFGLSQAVVASESSEKSYVSYCSNYSYGNQAVSYAFSSCVNTNFNSLGRDFDTPIYISYCSNFGNTVSYSFVSCINNNFSRLARELNRSIYLPHCGNYNQNELSYSFISCANDNFRRIKFELDNQ